MSIEQRGRWCAQTGRGIRLPVPVSQLAFIHINLSECLVTYPLEYLLPPHVLQPAVQIPDLLRQIINLALVRALNLARLANRQVQRELHAGMNTAAEPRTALLHILRNDAESVFSAVGSAEGEFARVGAALGDYAVIVIEYLFDGDEYADFGLRDVVLCVVVPDFDIVVTCAN